MASNSRGKSTMKSPIFVAVTKTISCEPPNFVCENYRYSAGQFAYVCFFRYIFPLKVARASRIWGPKSQRGQWHRCACHCEVNDTAVTSTAVSLKPLCNQLCRLSWRIRSHIRNASTCVSGTQVKLFYEKKQRSKISCQGHFNTSKITLFLSDFHLSLSTRTYSYMEDFLNCFNYIFYWKLKNTVYTLFKHKYYISYCVRAFHAFISEPVFKKPTSKFCRFFKVTFVSFFLFAKKDAVA
jgi:hypothetical protein